MSALRYRGLACIVLLAALPACATIDLVPAGPYVVGRQTVTLGRPWSDLSRLSPEGGKGARLPSIDGPLRNRLYIVDGLADGRALVSPTRKDRPTPRWRSDLSPGEQVEFVADSVSAMGYQRVETAGLRPARVGGVEALRFDIAARTAGGLDISGVAQVAESGGRLFLILYLAPTEHYFAAQRPEVDAILDSARIAEQRPAGVRNSPLD